MAEENGPHDPIGAILVKVQEDLYQLKRELYSAREGKEDLSDIQALETAIERTKMGLKIHVESYLSTINHHVLTTPIEEMDKFGRQPTKGWHQVGVPQKPFLFPQEDVCKKREGKTKGRASPLLHPSTKIK